MPDQLALTDATIASVLTDAEHAALLRSDGSARLGRVECLLGAIDELFFQAEFDADPLTGGLTEAEVLQLRGACKLVAHHLEGAPK